MKPPKDNKRWRKQAPFDEGGNCASQKEPENEDNYIYQKIYASSVWMSVNE